MGEKKRIKEGDFVRIKDDIDDIASMWWGNVGLAVEIYSPSVSFIKIRIQDQFSVTHIEPDIKLKYLEKI